MAEEDPYNNPDFKAFAARIGAHVLPMLRESAATLSLVPEIEEVDIKFAVELGLSVMLDKPIIMVIKPGMKISERLARVSDGFVECDLDDPEEMAGLPEKINALLNTLEEEGKISREGS